MERRQRPRVGLRLTSPEVAKEMLEAFLTTEADPSELHEIRKLD